MQGGKRVDARPAGKQSNGSPINAVFQAVSRPFVNATPLMMPLIPVMRPFKSMFADAATPAGDEGAGLGARLASCCDHS
tara:strand:- start:647 stop:883 length:237 start_codon:yes stop_codon:yes gene_type:complete